MFVIYWRTMASALIAGKLCDLGFDPRSDVMADPYNNKRKLQLRKNSKIGTDQIKKYLKRGIPIITGFQGKQRKQNYHSERGGSDGNYARKILKLKMYNLY